jgi:peptidoglycan/xylan/chitin deacetylase (PgdA/CDA1 family)
MYHRVGPVRRDSLVPGHYVPAARFRRQMKLLARLGYQTGRLGDWERLLAEPQKHLIVTFDDGYASFHRHALPALEAAGFSATVFLVSDYVGGVNAWDLALGDVEEPLMDASMIRDALGRGTEFGSHTRTHAHLTQINAEALAYEVDGSRAELAALLGNEIETFCYPYGEVDAAVREAVARAGYRVATTTRKASNRYGTDPLLLGRINVRASTGALQFLLKIQRAGRA